MTSYIQHSNKYDHHNISWYYTCGWQVEVHVVILEIIVYVYQSWIDKINHKREFWISNNCSIPRMFR